MGERPTELARLGVAERVVRLAVLRLFESSARLTLQSRAASITAAAARNQRLKSFRVRIVRLRRVSGSK